MIGQEHSVDNNRVYAGSDDRELLNIQIWYNQIADRRYTPRSIFVDLDSRSNDEVLSGPLGGLFNQDNFISGLNGTGSNWAKGHYTDGMELKGNKIFAKLNYVNDFIYIILCTFS